MVQEQQQTLEALQKAIQMEIDGKEFYQKASQASTNKLGKELLKKLSAEEDIHRKVFENIYSTISDKKGWPEQKIKHDSGKGLKTVFSEAMENMAGNYKPIPSELDAIQTAMEMENKTYDFYRAQGEKATYDAEKELYAALTIQEEEHHRVLLDYYEFLKDPAGYFVKTEHPSIDGG